MSPEERDINALPAHAQTDMARFALRGWKFKRIDTDYWVAGKETLPYRYSDSRLECLIRMMCNDLEGR